jgi:hypothetical protein
MPQGFEMCRKKGGKIRTKSLSGGKYMRICILNGKSYPGEVKKYKKVLKSKQHVSDHDMEEQ